MGYGLNEWVVIFAIYAFGGWLLESVYASMKRKRFVKRGFLTGVICPIYGFGAVLILGLFEWIQRTTPDPGWGLVLLFILSAIAVTVLEFAAGWMLEKLFQRKWWDYSQNRWNLYGYICPGFSLLWGGFALILVGVLHPAVEKLISSWPAFDYRIAAWLFMIDLVLDTTYTARAHLRDRHVICGLAEEMEEEYQRCVKELLEHEQVLRMADFIQHGRTTCLDHSLSVSYGSYRICKRLGLDYRSAARGGLLHDMFLYDWHEREPKRRWHGFTHPRTALTHAEACFCLNPVERDMILRHMWPLTPAFPRYPESYVITLVDKYVSLKEVFQGFRLVNRLPS
ncbi:putative ABC transporter permease [Gorillibacterium timonense]|uniref:putative ABC transporter permease n=1 Tax=Gorillibacterium timonense TaxID=1689269 RepID=UPI0009EAE01B|nr:hypothetical protein [Gorillibacterium timonense]